MPSTPLGTTDRERVSLSEESAVLHLAPRVPRTDHACADRRRSLQGRASRSVNRSFTDQSGGRQPRLRHPWRIRVAWPAQALRAPPPNARDRSDLRRRQHVYRRDRVFVDPIGNCVRAAHPNTAGGFNNLDLRMSLNCHRGVEYLPSASS